MNFSKNPKIFFLISLLFIFVACDKQGLKKHQYARDEIKKTFPKLKGEVIQKSNAQPKAKLIIIEFFQTWCEPCQMSVKHLNEIEKREDVKVISVSDEEKEKIEDFIKKFKPEYEMRQVSEELFEEMGIEYVPYAFIYRASDKKILWNDYPMKITDKLLDELKNK